ncbi:MAG: hypothetical protein Q4G27_04100 [Flavobacteriaceae bacterium]|nr:hypothetical protein [Flavobacteriaceae bacterium]
MNLELSPIAFSFAIIALYLFDRFFSFFDWFQMDGLELPDNAKNRVNIRNGYFVFIIYLLRPR